MNAIEIYIDESGDFGPFDERCPYYIVTMVLPIHSRIFQVADFICTLKRMSYRLKSTGSLAKSELKFFGTVANFQRNWLDAFSRYEWK